MPRIPRDISGQTLVGILKCYGYQVTRQTGSHIRLTCLYQDKDHHLTIPNHAYIKIGTLNSILNDLAHFLSKSKDELVKEIFV